MTIFLIKENRTIPYKIYGIYVSGWNMGFNNKG
jgi:hypothetical protein